MRFLTLLLIAVLGLFIVALAFSPAMKLQPAQTALDTDREFDAGSGIVIKDLTATQIANLALLGKVWGFLKYHHPLVTAGKKHWDYELFRIMPPVLNAADAATARSAIRGWIAALGDVPDCTTCAKLNERELHLRPPVTWLTDDALGPELGATLRAVYRNRSTAGRQHYLSLAPNAGNPSFDHELPYSNLTFPDAGYRLLALYRFWNIIEYWFPYRDVIGTNWDETLSAFIPRVAAAADAAALQARAAGAHCPRPRHARQLVELARRSSARGSMPHSSHSSLHRKPTHRHWLPRSGVRPSDRPRGWRHPRGYRWRCGDRARHALDTLLRGIESADAPP